MRVLGVTGGVGMGKSTVADLLRQRDVPGVDTDALAREVVTPGQPALEEIRRAFGADVLDAQGQLRRGEVARRVFAHETLRRQLEAITHPRIRARWHAQVAQWRAEGRPLAVIVIPLLFEVKAEEELDTVLCVACSAATQRQRLRARGWSDEQIAQRLRAQWPVEKKMSRAHFVVWTEGGLDTTAWQIDRILKSIDVSPAT
jgi:dephospho-CoA kinase